MDLDISPLSHTPLRGSLCLSSPALSFTHSILAASPGHVAFTSLNASRLLVLDAVVAHRALTDDENVLLVDFIHGRSDKTLADLLMLAPASPLHSVYLLSFDNHTVLLTIHSNASLSIYKYVLSTHRWVFHSNYQLPAQRLLHATAFASNRNIASTGLSLGEYAFHVLWTAPESNSLQCTAFAVSLLVSSLRVVRTTSISTKESQSLPYPPIQIASIMEARHGLYLIDSKSHAKPLLHLSAQAELRRVELPVDILLWKFYFSRISGECIALGICHQSFKLYSCREAVQGDGVTIKVKFITEIQHSYDIELNKLVLFSWNSAVYLCNLPEDGQVTCIRKDQASGDYIFQQIPSQLDDSVIAAVNYNASGIILATEKNIFLVKDKLQVEDLSENNHPISKAISDEINHALKNRNDSQLLMTLANAIDLVSENKHDEHNSQYTKRQSIQNNFESLPLLFEVAKRTRTAFNKLESKFGLDSFRECYQSLSQEVSSDKECKLLQCFHDFLAPNSPITQTPYFQKMCQLYDKYDSTMVIPFVSLVRQSLRDDSNRLFQKAYLCLPQTSSLKHISSAQLETRISLLYRVGSILSVLVLYMETGRVHEAVGMLEQYTNEGKLERAIGIQLLLKKCLEIDCNREDLSRVVSLFEGNSGWTVLQCLEQRGVRDSEVLKMLLCNVGESATRIL